MKKFKQLLINCIDEEITGTTIERLVKAKEIFESEMLWEKKPLTEYQIQKRLQDWLQGLCGTVSIPFESHEIIAWYEATIKRNLKNEHARERNDMTTEAQRFLVSYWPQCARSLYRLFYENGVVE